MLNYAKTKQRIFIKKILAWRKTSNFDYQYPWRSTKSTYKILISEILLKKTTREQVVKQWNIIIKNFPDFKDIINADLRKLKKILKPLGLENTRAKNLKLLSSEIVHNYNGKVPKTKEELLKLPGVGPYTANAVMCFAFKKDVSMVDTNILRVLQRVFSLKADGARPRTDKKIWEFAESLPLKGTGRDFNYAVLDFAATVCKATKPECSSCVMNKICDYYLNSKRGNT